MRGLYTKAPLVVAAGVGEVVKRAPRAPRNGSAALDRSQVCNAFAAG